MRRPRLLLPSAQSLPSTNISASETVLLQELSRVGLPQANWPPQMPGLGAGPPIVPQGPGMPGGAMPDYASRAMGVQSQGDLRHLWQMVTQVVPQLSRTHTQACRQASCKIRGTSLHLLSKAELPSNILRFLAPVLTCFSCQSFLHNQATEMSMPSMIIRLPMVTRCFPFVSSEDIAAAKRSII